MAAYELAQLNVALMKAPLDAPEMTDFVANLDRINALAEGSPGFVWRLQTEEGDATALRAPALGENVLVNMSVWSGVEALHAYVYRSSHVDVMRRRREWFERMREAYVVLWWVPRGHRPTMVEAADRLQRLREHGPTREAFTFRQAYPAPDAERQGGSSFAEACPAC